MRIFLTFFVLLFTVSSVFATNSGMVINDTGATATWSVGNTLTCAGANFHNSACTPNGGTLAAGASVAVVDTDSSGILFKLPFTVNGVANAAYSTCYTPPNGNWTVLLSGAAPPVYTNYTMTLVNPSSVYKAKAVWLYNGSVVQTLVLNPSSSGQWTTPSIKVSPAPADNFSLNGNVTILYTQMGNDDGGGLIFTNPSSSGGISGSGGTVTNLGGTFSGGTNTVTGGSGSVTVSTNGIVWSAPTGSASESTLQGGFSLLHKDNVDQLAGLNLINQSINAQTMMQTNQLGQISIWTRSNNDAMWQQTGIISNLLAKLPTNSPTFNAITNYATETTQTNILGVLGDLYKGFTNDFLPFFIGSFATNDSTNLSAYMDTNSPNLTTNFDAFVTTNQPNLDGATVSYDGLTNLDDVVAASDRVANSSGLKTQEDKFGDLLSGITDFSTEMVDFYPSVDMTFQFDYLGTSKQMDFDPLHWQINGGYPFVELFHLVRKLIMWLLALWFLIKVTEDAWKVILVITDASNINASSVKSTIKKNSQQGL